jgi:radical SAM protein with 4Fe4S-binding SPASM domain
MLQSDIFENLLNQTGSRLWYLTFYFQGEPYLHPQFTDLVKRASKKGIYTATSTNAHYLDEEQARKTIESGLDRLIISIDGTTQEVYEQYRVGGKLSKVLEGTRNIISWKKKLNSSTPHIIFQFLVVKPNEHQMEQVKELASGLGVDEVAFKTAQVYDFEQGNPLIPSNPRYARYEQQPDGKWRIRNRLLNHCWKLWHSCVITWDGTVVPCCFDKDAEHPMGSIKSSSFRELWSGDTYRVFRQSVLRSRSEIDMCKNCTEGTRVWETA